MPLAADAQHTLRQVLTRSALQYSKDSIAPSCVARQDGQHADALQYTLLLNQRLLSRPKHLCHCCTLDLHGKKPRKSKCASDMIASECGKEEIEPMEAKPLMVAGLKNGKM